MTPWNRAGASTSWQDMVWDLRRSVSCGIIGPGYGWLRRMVLTSDSLSKDIVVNPGQSSVPHDLQRGGGRRDLALGDGGGADGGGSGGTWRYDSGFGRVFLLG